MAMAALSSSVASKGLALVVSPPRCRRTHPVIFVSPHAHRQRSTTNSSGTNQIKRTTRIRAVDPDSANSLAGKLVIPIPDLLSVLTWPWMFGAAIAAAVPIYRRFRALEDNVEKAAEAAIEVIDSVAEATEKVAEEVAEAFPGNETLKHAASAIKAIADEIEEDADKAEALIEKAMAESVGGTSSHATWTSAMSGVMLTHLSNLVASGMRTAKGFKKVHLNGCARAVNEKFNGTITGDQVKNHLKTWQKKWSKIIKLKKLSAALFDEESCMITLDDEHYNGHVKDHKGDAEFLNKTIMYYKEMDAIFGNSMATGNFAKDSSAALGKTDDEAEEEDEEEEVTGNTTQGATSSTTRGAVHRPNKKAKVIDLEQDGLISVFQKVGDNLAEAIKEAGKSENEVPSNLFQILNALPGFKSVHVSAYYLHLCSNVVLARSFCNLPYENQLHWFTMYVCDKFPDYFPQV